MVWTNIAKPSAQTWTDSHPQGKEQYDESVVTYDSADVFYDGINMNMWTDVAKASTPSSWVSVAKPS